MSSPMQPFSIGIIPILKTMTERLLQRLNSEPGQDALWRVDTGQLSLSRTGAYRVIWVLRGGPVTKGVPGEQGQTANARALATRHVTVRAEIRVVDERTQGLTVDDLNVAERVQRQILWVLDEQLSGDDEFLEEDWSGYTDSPAQGQVILSQSFALDITVQDDPYYLVTPTSMEVTPHMNIPPEQNP